MINSRYNGETSVRLPPSDKDRESAEIGQFRSEGVGENILKPITVCFLFHPWELFPIFLIVVATLENEIKKRMNRGGTSAGELQLLQNCDSFSHSPTARLPLILITIAILFQS